MQIVPIQTFILRFDDLYDQQLFGAAKELLKNGGVLKREEKSALLSFVIVNANPVIEVKIFHYQKRSQKINCSMCGNDLSAPCVHALASMMLLEQDKKSKKKQSISPVNKLTIQAILEQTPKADLNAFLIEYAKRDRKFQLAMKVNFAYRLEVKDNTAKFKTILNDVIPIKTSVGSKISLTQLKYFLEIGVTFLHQIEDLFTLENYRESFLLYASLYNKLEYVLFQNNDNYDLRQLSQRLQTFSYNFFIPGIARDLQDDAVKFFLEIAEKSYYNIIEIHNNVFILLYELKHYTLIDKIRTILFDKLLVTKTDQSRAIYLALILYKMDDIDDAILKICGEYPLCVLPTYDHLVILQKTSIGLKLAETVFGDHTNNFQVIHRLLYGYITEKKFAKVRFLAVKAFLISKNTVYLEVVKDNFSDTQYAKVLSDIKQQLIKDKDTKKLFGFFNQMDLWQDAFMHLSLNGNIYDVQENDIWLHNHDTQRLEELYLKKLYELTVDQTEISSIETIKQTIKHLSKRRFFTLEKKVKAFLDNMNV
ncbi:MAG: hypothetical protein R2774_05970 [Saprospiraceae bacterium]